MSQLLFVFGRSHELSFHELTALFGGSITRITTEVAQVDDPQEELHAQSFIHELGGTVKIARMKGILDSLDPQKLAKFLSEEQGERTFGISMYGTDTKVDTGLLVGVKEALSSMGKATRYILPHEGNTLSSVVVTKQHVRELIIVASPHGYVVGETVAVQDFETWSNRDYGRPHADPKSGMLPPKVARIAVNLASSFTHSPSNPSPTLLDPFCGMGTILGEALLTGWNVIGSDQSDEVVGKAKKNLEWLLTGLNPVKRQGSTLMQPRVFVSDATHVSEHLLPNSVDAIVTEPFLGEARRVKSQESRVSKEDVKNIIKGLEKLYIGCLRDWYRVLKPQGKIVIALPQYAVGTKTYFVKNVIDRCESLGYTVSAGPLSYSRPQAVVRRQFYVLKKL